MTKRKDDPITIKFDGVAAEELYELKENLGVQSTGEVIRQALTLLNYSLGGKLTIEKDGKLLKFDQFKNKRSLPKG